MIRRPAEIRKLLAGLRGTKRASLACDFYRGAETDRKIIAAHDGGVGMEHYRQWMFRTGAPKVWGQYFEVWSPADAGGNMWTLQAAYLTILKLERGAGSEILGVHCDPLDKSGEPMRSFKKGPHLHVKWAREPLPRSHIPLNYGHVDEVLEDVAAFTKALGAAIFVVRHEVLARF